VNSDYGEDARVLSVNNTSLILFANNTQIIDKGKFNRNLHSSMISH